MIHSLIHQKASSWAESESCPIRPVLDYIRRTGKMRPVQLDAIQSYLFLKIACENRPLHELFSTGTLNDCTPDELRVSRHVHDFLSANPASLALHQFASQPLAKGRGLLAGTLKERLETEPESIDAAAVFRELFYSVPYTD
ncbi:MAG: hypothetical protein IJS15_03760 [Victivallales bacterium]|nr:hypothetical protein [Victivallales bacterium]